MFLNWSNPLVHKEMLDVFRFWTRLGVDGFYLKNLHLIRVDTIEDIYTILPDILSIVDPFSAGHPDRNHLDTASLDERTGQSTGLSNSRKLGVSSSVSVRDDASSSAFSSAFSSASSSTSSFQEKQYRRILITSRSSLQKLQHRHQYEAEYFSLSPVSSSLSSSIQEASIQVSSSSSASSSTEYSSAQVGLQEAFMSSPGEKRVSRSVSSLVSKSSLNPAVISSLSSPVFTSSFPSHPAPGRQGSVTASSALHWNKEHRDVYSYFHLIDTFLDLKMNETEDLRDRVNEVFLNEPDSRPWILWNLGSVTSSRLVTRINPELVTTASFLLFMLPGSISILYGDEIGLRSAVDEGSKKVSTHLLVFFFSYLFRQDSFSLFSLFLLLRYSFCCNFFSSPSLSFLRFSHPMNVSSDDEETEAVILVGNHVCSVYTKTRDCVFLLLFSFFKQ